MNRAALILNPTTVDDAAVIDLVRARCAARGWVEPLVLRTAETDSGTAAAREAVDAEVDLVLSCGGDGTLAAVATALAGTGIPVGVLPSGTGNLLSRNLGLPMELEPALEMALGSGRRAIDLGCIGDHRFVVMAGMGLDAAIMRDASPRMKTRMGWVAYVVAGIAHVRDDPMAVQLRLDDGPALTRHARAVLIGNVGRLQGGLRLLPDADPSDGMLDVAVVAPAKMHDWFTVLGRVVARRRTSDRTLERFRARRVDIDTTCEHPCQFDGESLGPARTLSVQVQPAALTVVVP